MPSALREACLNETAKRAKDAKARLACSKPRHVTAVASVLCKAALASLARLAVKYWRLA